MAKATAQYRQRMKEDPQKYAEYLEKERERSKRYRQRKMDNFIIDNSFLEKTSETYKRYVFNTRKQKAHETMDDYISALCTLASNCNFCDCLKDSLLRDRIVLGITDSSTRKRLLQEGDLNLETCIAMCRAAEATSSSQPVKTETWTEDTTAVQAGSVSSGDQRPGKKQDFSLSLRRCDPMASPDEVEMSEVNFNTELDDFDDSALQWTTAHQSSGFPRHRTDRNKPEPAWSMGEDSPDQPSAVYSTAQPMSDYTSGSLLSLNTSHECYLCSAAFVLVSSLELHIASVHGEKLHMVLPGSSTPDRFDAGNCSNTGIDKEADAGGKKKGRKKKKVDEDGRKRSRHYMCDVCGKSFPASRLLKRHKLTHSSLKTFVCDVCGKSFSQSRNLTIHKRVHTDERPYKCLQCNIDFKWSSNLRRHIKSAHEDAVQNLCDVCGAAFTTNGSLTVHRRIHTGEKPYVCSDCGKRFTRSVDLDHHRLTHTGEKPHLCPDCGKGFALSGALRRHRRTHYGIKPYNCPHCPYASTQSGNLKMHIKTKHH